MILIILLFFNFVCSKAYILSIDIFLVLLDLDDRIFCVTAHMFTLSDGSWKVIYDRMDILKLVFNSYEFLKCFLLFLFRTFTDISDRFFCMLLDVEYSF